ncbi:hypothetical protein J3B02_001058 [Coemansia erecta]|uniref:CobW/HypB/UreG nucleotide-binding domain-containing protein n=1 Tax=Coemansia asiatica TaxID=1052880 RepID=A0A9W7XMD0_9FUNG|nr:hypothetical protein LPJ64_003107 [Coemansia asiatica]KAJ2857359.1 hypothetical protein J3B02_001058 [Coemansia erecta]KAJ2888496.1 hypothetical protein FB639_000602 [Coemansia asiatica]
MSVVQNSHKSLTVISDSTTPVTVFTGFLGAGKTSIILNLLKRADPDYKIVLLKNEFGDAKTDSALVRESHVQIAEMTNGCLCCVLVGQMKRALEELKEKYRPDRIIIETSGSAFPAPIAWQIREMEPLGFHLDAILTVIDCLNFCGYEDTSYTARMQAQYTDLILLNKWESATERQLDLVIDHVNELNTDTPKLKADRDLGVDPNIVFGIDTPLFLLSERDRSAHYGGGALESNDQLNHHKQEVDVIDICRSQGDDFTSTAIDTSSFISFLKDLPTDEVYRVKGIICLSEAAPDDSSSTEIDTNATDKRPVVNGILYILNHAFGRFTFTRLTLDIESYKDVIARITVIGNGLRIHLPAIQKGLSASKNELTVHWAICH